MYHNTHLQGLKYVHDGWDQVEIGGTGVVVEGARAVDVAHSLLTSRLYNCTFSEAVFKGMMDALRGNANIRELRM
jgi:hypothetical protein